MPVGILPIVVSRWGGHDPRWAAEPSWVTAGIDIILKSPLKSSMWIFSSYFVTNIYCVFSFMRWCYYTRPTLIQSPNLRLIKSRNLGYPCYPIFSRYSVTLYILEIITCIVSIRETFDVKFNLKCQFCIPFSLYFQIQEGLLRVNLKINKSFSPK